MDYRDLVPDRRGGALIASHIRVERGGPVADYVHYHDVRAQLIYCVRGWVRLVYEDQGEPFVMTEGDCVVQPPQIRHRVLECSPGLEVVEVAAPAVHATHVDHDLALPTQRRDRTYSGQRFAWCRAGELAGIAEATHGLAEIAAGDELAIRIDGHDLRVRV
jgi:quercetin dioxygenase-like cupin family protein